MFFFFLLCPILIPGTNKLLALVVLERANVPKMPHTELDTAFTTSPFPLINFSFLIQKIVRWAIN